MRTIVYRGTPVTCAKDAADLFSAAGDDVTLQKTRIGSNMLVNSAVYGVLQQNWVKLIGHIAAETEIRISGHSLGAAFGLVSVALIPRSVSPRVFAFAPFQCANQPFWKATYDGRPIPKIYGRARDFAPGWDHIDRNTCPAGQICHLLDGGKTEMVNAWPWLNESIGDHDVDRYVADMALIGDEEAHTMCRLSSAIYLTDIGDVIELFAAMGFKTLDVIEAPGFRAAVLESSD